MAVCFLTPIYTSSEKRPPISDHIKGPLVAAFRSPLMKALDRSVETLGLWIVTSSVTFIKSTNQSSIKLCLIVHLVAVWTLIYFNLFLFSPTNGVPPLSEYKPTHDPRFLQSLWRRAHARNVNFFYPLWWLIYVFKSVVNTKLPAILSHRRSTAVSLETYPFSFISCV